jgi:hypothetical protein
VNVLAAVYLDNALYFDECECPDLADDMLLWALICERHDVQDDETLMVLLHEQGLLLTLEEADAALGARERAELDERGPTCWSDGELLFTPSGDDSRR